MDTRVVLSLSDSHEVSQTELPGARKKDAGNVDWLSFDKSDGEEDDDCDDGTAADEGDAAANGEWLDRELEALVAEEVVSVDLLAAGLIYK